VALKTDHTIWYWNGTTLAHLPGAALKVASDPLGTIYVIGTDKCLSLERFELGAPGWLGLYNDCLR
jgi:hypothetical protein